MRKRILISAAGTATAFHLAELITTRFREHFALYLCDTNPRHLVASAGFADHFFTIVPVAHPEFRSRMLDLFRKHRIDIYVPLIDTDVYSFLSDDPDLLALGVRSTAPPTASGRVLRNKRMLMEYLRTKHVGVPRTFEPEDVLASDLRTEYFVKPQQGWGSSGARTMTAEEIQALPEERRKEILIQEICRMPELTVEVYNGNCEPVALSRERIETKSGVCTKARLAFDPEITALACRLCREISLPVAFCFQLMKSPTDQWLLTDLNARLGAGTSLSSAAGWSLAEAALITWAGLPLDPSQAITPFEEERFVVRAYKDIRTQ